jgi:hypothetical protein
VVLLSGLKPLQTIANKGTVKEYQVSGLVTISAQSNSLDGVSDGGYVSGINNLSNNFYNAQYECVESGQATLNVSDLVGALSSFVAI